MNGHLPCLEGMSFVEVSLCSEHVPGGFDGRAGPEVSGDCIFSQGVLAATTVVGGRAGVGGATARASPRLHTSCHPIVGGVESQVAGVGVLRELNLPPD